MSRPPGRYNSERRRQQAEQTHRDILRAAHRLFTQQGYARTSMEDIAREAGVAVQTVYAAVGAKRALLLRLNDLIDEDSGVAEFLEQLARATTGRAVIRLVAGLTRRFSDRSGSFLTVLETAAAGDPELGEILAESRRRHTEGTRGVAMRMAAAGMLRPGLSGEQAAQLLGVLTWTDVYVQLGRDYGLSLDEAEAWIAAALERLLLPEDGGEQAAGP